MRAFGNHEGIFYGTMHTIASTFDFIVNTTNDFAVGLKAASILFNNILAAQAAVNPIFKQLSEQFGFRFETIGPEEAQRQLREIAQPRSTSAGDLDAFIDGNEMGRRADILQGHINDAQSLSDRVMVGIRAGYETVSRGMKSEADRENYLRDIADTNRKQVDLQERQLAAIEEGRRSGDVGKVLDILGGFVVQDAYRKVENR